MFKVTFFIKRETILKKSYKIKKKGNVFPINMLKATFNYIFSLRNLHSLKKGITFSFIIFLRSAQKATFKKYFEMYKKRTHFVINIFGINKIGNIF